MSDVNIVRGAGGALLHSSTWPMCHSCDRRSEHVEALVYRGANGILGESYPDCGGCRRGNASRLERMGFTILKGDARTGGRE